MTAGEVFNRQVFDNEYFTGAQVQIFLGDALIDEIVGLQFETIANKTPRYGYASTYFDGVSQGVHITRGTFSINYKFNGYMFAALDRYQKLQKGRSIISPYVNQGGIDAITQNKISELINLSEGDPRKQEIITDMTQRIAEGDMKLANQISDAIWQGQDKFISGSDGNTQIHELRSPTHSFFDGFDMYIKYGDYGVDGAALPNTVEKLESVYIIGKSKVITLSDENVIESYPFLARKNI